jgi:hypothetical protein
MCLTWTSNGPFRNYECVRNLSIAGTGRQQAGYLLLTRGQNLCNGCVDCRNRSLRADLFQKPESAIEHAGEQTIVQEITTCACGLDD